MLRSITILSGIYVVLGLAACSNSSFTGTAMQSKASENRTHAQDKPPQGTELDSRSPSGIDDQITIESGETRPFDALPQEIIATDLGQLVRGETSDASIVTVDPVTGDLTGMDVGSAVVTYIFAQGKTLKVLVTVTPASIETPTDTQSSTSTGTATSTEPNLGTQTATSTTTSTATSTDGLTSDEQEIIDALPGVEAIRVGVNFEDMGTRGDKDFNDAVLCFEGMFKVEGSQVVSIRDQEVIGTTSSLSGCNHTMRVEIIDLNGNTLSTVSFDSKAAQPVKMKFDVGSRLEVFMTATESSKNCDPGLRKNMHSAIDALVAANVCRTVGK